MNEDIQQATGGKFSLKERKNKDAMFLWIDSYCCSSLPWAQGNSNADAR